MGVFKEIDIAMMELEIESELTELDKQLLLLDIQIAAVVDEAEQIYRKAQVQVERTHGLVMGW